MQLQRIYNANNTVYTPTLDFMLKLRQSCEFLMSTQTSGTAERRCSLHLSFDIWLSEFEKARNRNDQFSFGENQEESI